MFHKKTLLVLVVACLMHDMLFGQMTSPVDRVLADGAAFIDSIIGF
jgi:hypothetical protein